MNFIKCTTDCKLSIIDIPATDYRAIAKSIGSDIFEIVRINEEAHPPHNTVMLADKEGLLKPENKCNPLGSVLYGTLNHGHPIAGDILITRINRNDPEHDFEDIPSAEAEKIIASMQKVISALTQSGIADMLRRRYDNTKPEAPIIMPLDLCMDGGE